MKEKLTVEKIEQEYSKWKSATKFDLFFELFLYLFCFTGFCVCIFIILPVNNSLITFLLVLFIILVFFSVYIFVKDTINNIKTLRKIKLRINQLQTGDFTLEKDVLQQKVLKNNVATGILENSTDVLFLTEQEFNEVDSGSIVYRVKFADIENKSVYGPYYFDFEYDVSAVLT